MRKPKAIAGFGLGLLILAIILLAALKALPRRQGGAGSGAAQHFMRLVSVSVGTNFSYKVGRYQPWMQTLLKALPPALGSLSDGWLGMGSGTMGFSSYRGETNLAVFTASEAPGGFSLPTALVVGDNQGNRFLAATGGATIGSDDGKVARYIRGWSVQAFPRRTGSLRLSFVQLDPQRKSWQPLAEFKIRNPLAGNYPVWHPEPLPATKTDGGLDVTLADLQTGLSLNDPNRAAQDNEVPVTRARFQLREAGRPTSSWRPILLEIADATGNHWSPFIPADSLKHGEGGEEILFIGALWPGEAAWKLRWEFSRTADFDPNELWTVRGLPVPPANESRDLQETVTNQNALISLVAFTGAATDAPGQFKWLMSKGEPRVSVHVEPPSEGWRLSIARAEDNQGREVETSSSPDSPWNDNNKEFALRLHPGASSVSLTFAWHRSRFVEFLAHPGFATTASASTAR